MFSDGFPLKSANFWAIFGGIRYPPRFRPLTLDLPSVPARAELREQAAMFR